MITSTALPELQASGLNGKGSTGDESPLHRAKRILSGGIHPEDYLSVPEDIIEFADGAESRGGMKLLPEYRRRMISFLTLQQHHGGTVVLTRHTPEGVIVLASGLADVHEVEVGLTSEEQSLVETEFPATPFE